MAKLQIDVTLTGQSPLLMHSERLANPLNGYARELARLNKAKKRKGADKDEILRKTARTEWEGGLYWHAKYGPHVPAHCLRAAIREAARLQRGGKTVERGLAIVQPFAIVKHPGPTTLEGLWTAGPKHLEGEWDAGMDHVDLRMVRVSTAKVLRCRPKFPDWSLTFTAQLDDRVLDPGDLQTYIDDCGAFIGLLEGRTMGFGRFSATYD